MQSTNLKVFYGYFYYFGDGHYHNEEKMKEFVDNIHPEKYITEKMYQNYLNAVKHIKKLMLKILKMKIKLLLI